MGAIVSQVYEGVQYMIGCSTNNKAITGSETFQRKAMPLILKRTGSMYFDDDGDLAHEFYEEVKPTKQGEKAGMRLLTERLSPQGVVDLPYPRLHVDFPIVMCKAWS
ncbi:tumor suppressor candidate 2-like [Actinia tenebrosa]|uniref:Tumor suppressor candidate 2-like n=1 Tax=Actinia tenebrosa TaxID=6105 RepID=A0A6P8H371_ACTTE|nr:tumor suppressor candidate 2-like [Actinia tenebrosa]